MEPFDDFITDKDGVIRRIEERLTASAVSFDATYHRYANAHTEEERRDAAGVLIPLLYRQSHGERAEHPGYWVIQLIRRAHEIPQGGDVSAPGGMLEPIKDGFFHAFLRIPLTAVMGNTLSSYEKHYGSREARTIGLFLATALRESWEETGLNPFRVRFLGALPVYHLTLFQKSIFPLVGYVTRPWTFTPNREVDGIVEISLSSLFDPSRYGTFTVRQSPADEPLQFPCFLHQSPDTPKEVLWGATFFIVMSFLSLIFDFDYTRITPAYETERVLGAHYASGKKKEGSNRHS